MADPSAVDAAPQGRLLVMRVALLSDTHGPRRWKRCPAGVARHLRDVDLILHAGDACTAEVLDELTAFAPVHAVIGNNDAADVVAWGATPSLEIDIDGLPVAMVHDSGPATGRAARLRRMYPTARVVAFGHSHIPWDQEERGQRVINPGSPTDRVCTVQPAWVVMTSVTTR